MESGAIQFGDDWPGMFIRGDHAHSLLFWIRRLQTQLVDHPNPDVADALSQLEGFAETIEQDVLLKHPDDPE